MLTPKRPFRIAAHVAALLFGISAVAGLAQAQDRPSRECVQEIRALCGSDRSQIRSCLQARFSELSEACAAQIRERMGARLQGRQQDQTQAGEASEAPRRLYQPTIRPTTTVVYGQHQRQQVNVFEPDGAVDELPMVVFIHGGGWAAGSHLRVQSKPAFFGSNDYYFASAGYRILPDFPVEQQARDLGDALRALRAQAPSIGFDPDRIVLMGHSAGAHLAALLATDPSYAGEAFASIQGVILLDGAGYDVSANMQVAGPRGWQIYNTAFSSDPERQSALSPITHVGGEDAPNWLALYVEEREIARDQAQMFTEALMASGATAQAISIAGTDHGRMNREIGTEAGAAQSQIINEFLARLFP